MKNIPDLAHAMSFAEECHSGQVDKSGVMYILHPLRVMRQKGYSQEIVDALDCLTKREEESYEDFIERCKQNLIALKVSKMKLLREKSQKTREIYHKSHTDKERG